MDATPLLRHATGLLLPLTLAACDTDPMPEPTSQGAETEATQMADDAVGLAEAALDNAAMGDAPADPAPATARRADAPALPVPTPPVASSDEPANSVAGAVD